MHPYVTDSDRAAAQQFLISRIDYERTLTVPYGIRDFKLDRMVRLLARLGDPQRGLKIVHVAGTKGKGSTAAMISSVLTAAGYRTGLYTSPHLDRVEERVAIDGVTCPADEFVELVERIRPVIEELDAIAAAEQPSSHGPTYFEVITAMALVYFADQRVDAAVLEVGLGGRLDSTNVCLPAVSVITSISFDHTRQLGNTLAAIAGEKAGIIKSGVPVVSGVVDDEPREVIRAVAAQHGCRLIERTIDFDAVHYPATHLEKSAQHDQIDFKYRVHGREESLDGVAVSLLGAHQAINASVALATLAELRAQGWHIDEPAVRRGMAQVQWPARVEVIRRRPTVVLDAAHNLASVEALLRTLDLSVTAQKRILVFATTRDKDAQGMLELLTPKFDAIVLTRYQNNPRGVPEEELAGIVAGMSCASYSVSPTPAEAWRKARALAGPEDLIVITGSFFIAADMRAAMAAEARASDDES